MNSRERAVAALVAAGNGNRAAAAALAVSEKTIEKCLTSIYAKLGLTSRTQLAGYLASEKDVSS